MKLTCSIAGVNTLIYGLGSVSLILAQRGNVYPVGKKPGNVYGYEIITNPESLPEGVDLAVILVPAKVVPEIMEICGRKEIHRAIISSAGFSEFNDKDNAAERDVQVIAKQYGIRFIGPNCIGVMCVHSGLCTSFNPMRPQSFEKGSISLISQSGGVATQAAYIFSEEHVGFSKIISVGNKLDINEIDLLQYLMNDEDTEQIHLYLESIEDGRTLMMLAGKSKKPVVLFKSNTGKAASVVAVSTSGGFAVVLGDLCEKYGFECPELPRQFLNILESKRRGGIINISNPMDLGDIYSPEAVLETLEDCLALDNIDGIVLSYMYGKEMSGLLNAEIGAAEQILRSIKNICERTGKPVALSLFAERRYTEEFKKTGIFPVFNNPEESVRALRMPRNYWRGKNWRGLDEAH